MKRQAGTLVRYRWTLMVASFSFSSGLERPLGDQFVRVAPLSGPPQTFEIIELSRAGGENVNDEIDVIQEYPFAFTLSFDVERANTVSFQCFFDMFGNGLIVTGRSAGADKKVIRERADFAEFDDHCFLGFLIERCFDGFG
jgi:hypothetical protein